MKVPGNQSTTEDAPVKEDEFSEYLWMENEEEFDAEVMRQLEEEALMEQCIQVKKEPEEPVNGSKEKEDDFSEFMWMEKEEEFDAEVMRQLEEEAFMEQCIQAMLDDEKDASQAFNEVTSRIGGMTIQDKTQIVSESKLNPDAAEFVPRAPAKPSTASA